MLWLPVALLAWSLVPPPEPLKVRPVGELADDRFEIAMRAREDMQRQYNGGLATSDQLLTWDERVLEAYLECCARQEDRLKGLRYYLEKAAAVHDFEKRRVAARGGQPTAEYLEALYAMHSAAQRLAEAEKNPKAMNEAARARIQAAQQGFEENLRLLKEGKARFEKTLLWSNRWVHATWVSTVQAAGRMRAVQEHLARIGAVEEAIKNGPPPRGRPPVIDAETEIAFRRAEAELWVAPASQMVLQTQRRLQQAAHGRDRLLEAFRSDKAGIEPVLVWLDRWSDAKQTNDIGANRATQEECVVLLREMERLARQHHGEGSRHIAESDFLTLGYFRLAMEHALAGQRQK